MSIYIYNKNRVLSIDEVKKSDFVYVEFNPAKAILDNYVEPCGIGDSSVRNYICLLLRDSGTYSYKQFLSVKDYNIIWRCWRSKPTMKEMRQTEWINKTD